jgi:hypothetical protein
MNCFRNAGSLLLAVGLILDFPMKGQSDQPTATLRDIATDASDPLNLADTEPSIAVNPANSRQIAIVTFSENWDPNNPAVMAPVWKSDDGGMTWRKVRQIPRPAAGLFGPGDQKITFDASGRLYIAELGIGGGAHDFIYRQTGSADAPLTPGSVYGDDQPHLAVDGSGQSPFLNALYSPWLLTSVAKNQSTVAISSNGGVTVVNVAVGNNTSFPNRTTRIALAKDGKAYIVYKTREGTAGGNFENAHFYVKRSDDGGATWSALGSNGVSVHGPNAVQTYFTNNWGNPAKGKVARARSSDAWIAVNPIKGDVFAVHVRKDNSGFGQIYMARSADQGVTWTNSRVTDGTHHSAYPEIAVAGNGTVGVLYIDYDDSGASTLFRHHFARSFDNGVTWTDQVLQSMDPGPISNAASGFLWGDYEGVTASSDRFYGVFTGQSIGRTTLQLDPIFFSESAEPVGSDNCVCSCQKHRRGWFLGAKRARGCNR